MPDVEGLEWVTEAQEQQLTAWYGDEWATNAIQFIDSYAGDGWQDQADADKANALDEILAGDHRMRRDGLDVEAIDDSYKAAFKAAMKPITDKGIDWV